MRQSRQAGSWLKPGPTPDSGIPSSDLESYWLIYLDLIRIDVVTWAADVGVPRGDQRCDAFFPRACCFSIDLLAAVCPSHVPAPQLAAASRPPAAEPLTDERPGPEPGRPSFARAPGTAGR
jgi:hypothetical protein